jgi:hypothetical protein
VDQIAKIVTEGYVAELDGKFFGQLYADGQSTQYGFAGIETATIVDDPQLGPEGLTYEGSPYAADLKKAKYTKIRYVQTFERVIEPIEIPPALRQRIETAMKMKIPLKGCNNDPRYLLEVKDVLKYFITNRIESLVVNHMFGSYTDFSPHETVTLEWFIRNHLWEYSAPAEYYNHAQADDELLKALTDTGLFEVVLDNQTRYDQELGGRPVYLLHQHAWARPVKCLRLLDIEEEQPVNQLPLDKEEPEDALSLDEQLHLESQHEDNESIRATEEAEERMRDEE